MADGAVIRTEQERQALIDTIKAVPLPCTFSWKDGVVKTDPQNDTLWMWNSQIAKWRGDVTKDDVHRENKLLIGCAILMDDPEFRNFVQQLSGMSYEEKLGAMDFIDVTSIMSKEEMSLFMDRVFQKWTERGVSLTVPKK